MCFQITVNQDYNDLFLPKYELVALKKIFLKCLRKINI